MPDDEQPPEPTPDNPCPQVQDVLRDRTEDLPGDDE
jgi:hypothetical protein